ncbi:hypothetical protein SFR_6859 [Streptomyces sp. FR-008]|nr:hypothetical protein SFR_6859 [Streptomyces sp. FR-008]
MVGSASTPTDPGRTEAEPERPAGTARGQRVV